MDITYEKIQEICNNIVVPFWNKQKSSFPVFLNEVYDEEQDKGENEKLIDKYMKKFPEGTFDKIENINIREALENKKIEKEVHGFIKQEKLAGILKNMGDELYFQFESETKRFIKKAYVFDEKLDNEQIIQSIRNYFIYVMIVDFQGEKQEASDVIVAYSLLYPYTDNVLDDVNITMEEKVHMDNFINMKLKEEYCTPHSSVEEKIGVLLERILHNYKGIQKEKVRMTLLLLLDAQHKSIGQIDNRTDMMHSDVLNLSAYKGGTSVLADYLLATDNYDDNEIIFYMKFGFILQLVDDLQDITEDENKGSRTLMTIAKSKDELEETVYRLLWYIYEVFQGVNFKNERLKKFAMRHCIGIVLISAVVNEELFSDEYIRAAEEYLPLSVQYINDMKTRFKK